MTRRAQMGVAAVVLAGLALAGCDPSPAVKGSGPDGGAGARYVAQAALAPCPATSPAAAVIGGLPDLTLPCLGHGPSVDLADLRGRPMVVNLWAQWCSDCGKEAAALSTAARQDPSVRFLGVDTKETSLDGALAFDAQTVPSIHYPSVVDERGTLLADVKRFGLPVTLLVSPAGRIVHEITGPVSSAAALEQAISTYLGAGT